mmetsp:Transcript_2592/g.8264  ORF Transcript_2592/g.8264 Transcript_2592/m.8264 type:complete len:254 (-) Transcript_2592:117-878(-)
MVRSWSYESSRVTLSGLARASARKAYRTASSKRRPSAAATCRRTCCSSRLTPVRLFTDMGSADASDNVSHSTISGTITAAVQAALALSELNTVVNSVRSASFNESRRYTASATKHRRDPATPDRAAPTSVAPKPCGRRDFISRSTTVAVMHEMHAINSPMRVLCNFRSTTSAMEKCRRVTAVTSARWEWPDSLRDGDPSSVSSTTNDAGRGSVLHTTSSAGSTGWLMPSCTTGHHTVKMVWHSGHGAEFWRSA